MNKIIKILIFIILPFAANAQSYNGEVEAFFLTVLIFIAPVSFLIGLPLAISFKRKVSQKAEIGLLRTAAWFFAFVNIGAGLAWAYFLYFMFLAGGLGTGDWGFILAFLIFSIGGFIPAILMYQGDKMRENSGISSLKKK